MLPGCQPSIFELFGPRRMQKVNSLPVEAPLARTSMRWGFCSVVKTVHFEFMHPFVGGRSPAYRGVGTNRWALLKAEDTS